MITYRLEIDGLRAIAVVPVILFHAGFDLFDGGYAGVDVFFVISGYLITSLVVGELDRGEFSLLRFYERRARRILPALFVMVAACIPFAWMWMIPVQLESFSYSVSAVAVFLSNFFFMDDTGYFGFANDLKPLLHTWSLAVEEQYYIAMPLITIVLWRFGFAVTAIVSVIVALASFALCVVLVRYQPDPAFFLPFTRAWELQLGALCALYLMKRRLAANDMLAGAGLLLVIGSFLALDRNMPFPSEFALAPTLGTALVILFANRETYTARLLSHPVLNGIGLISYSAYLWHQPLFAFARIRMIEDPGPVLMLALAGAALVLGYLSWRFIERPFRLPAGAPATRSIRLPGTAVAIVAILAAGGLYGRSMDGFPERLERAGGSAFSELVAKAGAFKYPSHCSPYEARPDIEPCLIFAPTRGVTGARQRIAVFGDSHSYALLPAYSALGDRFEVYAMPTVGCVPLLDTYVITTLYDIGSCKAQAQKQLDLVHEKSIGVVFLVGKWMPPTMGRPNGDINWLLLSKTGSRSGNTIETSREAFKAGIAVTAQKFHDAGALVVFVDQVPQQLADPREILEKLALSGRLNLLNDAVYATSVSVADDQVRQSYSQKAMQKLAADVEGVSYLSFDSRFQRGNRYIWGEDGVLLYNDSNHLSAYGAESLEDAIAEHLNGILSGMID